MFIDYDVQELFADRLKTLIADKGLSVKQFSIQIGIADSTISDWIHKKRIPLIIQIPKIAAFFNVSIDYLLGYKEFE